MDQKNLDSRVADLHSQGLRVRQIVNALGPPHTLAQVKQSLARCGVLLDRQKLTAARFVSQDRHLEWLIRKLVKALRASGADMDPRTVRCLLDAFDRQARLHGLDKPTASEATVTVDYAEVAKRYGISLPPELLK